ncbi:50S ribosomal protein L23 [Chlamydiales bacterium SCGC AG-110-M15]|nr:50S ribosomal protein L23 [Chlamydiales bacterium SCGC AG-110-M15]
MNNASNSPYNVILSRYSTEKSVVLEGLKDSDSNPSIAKCKLPKFVFLVAKSANKAQIAQALEEIYEEQKVKVVAVNTISIKGKAKSRRRNSRPGKTKAFKKAIVTFEEGDMIDNI